MEDMLNLNHQERPLYLMNNLSKNKIIENNLNEFEEIDKKIQFKIGQRCIITCIAML